MFSSNAWFRIAEYSNPGAKGKRKKRELERKRMTNSDIPRTFLRSYCIGHIAPTYKFWTAYNLITPKKKRKWTWGTNEGLAPHSRFLCHLVLRFHLVLSALPLSANINILTWGIPLGVMPLIFSKYHRKDGRTENTRWSGHCEGLFILKCINIT